ncbi:Gfo/Idh/MocA family oxidoreductase [Muricauda sp. 2012CJ35-5]|uniref:Gfo/Idh/MocA family oxidoreductase n=1 Tax=Flagellimonas spongiicola TaxID=2942208 RepID=A0ABT0PQ78_9FLAO|nr:Gfo/Idh/MocA family oxidoreductase [Allomuricauda spongiicola]MCL6273552.1 Gfo/Idh/MocA family oxidoreductase [Allomuricauda spongiicola]
MKSKIKWGIIGPGNIARKFSSDLLLIADAEITAVASRSFKKARQFADEYGAKHAFDSYDALFESGTVDIVYIATPHNFHKDLSIKAMANGLHVLCEKPAGINQAEVQEMIEAAKAHDVFFMEGLWSRFNPTILKVKELLDKGELGAISYLHADFAFYGMDRGEDSRVLNLNLASGSLLDIGIYPIFLAYLLMGYPEEILAKSKFHDNGTEIQTSMLFQYKNAQAVLYSGLTSNSKMEAEISCTNGNVFIQPRWHEAQGFTLQVKDEVNSFELPTQGNGFVYEIEHVHHCLFNNLKESPLWSHKNSMDLVALMDKIRQTTGISFPFEN